jgi:hypothetical protein
VNKKERPDWVRLAAWIDRLEDAMSLDRDSTARFNMINEFMNELYDAHIVYSFD